MYQAAELMKMFPSQMKNSQESRKWAIRCLNDTNHEETKKIFDEQNEIDLFDEFGQDELIDDIEFPFFQEFCDFNAKDMILLFCSCNYKQIMSI